jgi:pimeloyl-ACP methyl ester carboxylesterase
MRSRSVGEPRPGVPEVVLVQGMAVADYLMPAVAELGRWTRAHLVELPGFAGSGEPTRTLDVPGYAGAVVEWLDAAKLGPVVLAGHSSGTQVAARAAVRAGTPVVARCGRSRAGRPRGAGSAASVPARAGRSPACASGRR